MSGCHLKTALITINLLMILSFPMIGRCAQSDKSPLYPLEPPNLTSPRGTISSLDAELSEAYKAFLKNGGGDPSIFRHLARAKKCLNLSEVAPSLVHRVGVERAVQLGVILTLIPMPVEDSIPGPSEVEERRLDFWTIPHTEITLARVDKGPSEGRFLFSAQTVARIPEFFEEMRAITHEDSDIFKEYDAYMYAPGGMIPETLLKALPDWFYKQYDGQTVWQWTALVLILILEILFLWLFYALIWKKIPRDRNHPGWGILIGRFMFPMLSMASAYAVLQFLIIQINITGKVMKYLVSGYNVTFHLFGVWGVICLGTIVKTALSKFMERRRPDVPKDMITLCVRLSVIGLVLMIMARGMELLGLPVTALFASAGVVGLAVALAARETLANFFGGVSLLMDKPFKAGDYIVLDSGERGEVKEVGMRSTRILTRDDILITIPNSLITNLKITNQSAPHPSFRVRLKVGVAYGTDVALLKKALMEIATNNDLVDLKKEPRVRFRSFGDSSLDFELLCWANRPHDRGKLMDELNTTIYNRLNELEIEIPFPQRDVYLKSEGSSGLNVL